MNLSKYGISRIIEWETGGEAEYNRHPEWPGESSGITIGIGYDVGQMGAAETQRAWAAHLDQATLKLLVSVTDKRGEAAQSVLPFVRHLEIPWTAAQAVFTESTLPSFYLKTLRIYPQAVDLHGDCCAALVSLVFNRGPKLTGDRRTEMLEIQTALRAGELGRIPALFESQTRLWPDSRGLRRRRVEEAELFQRGLLATVPAGE